MDLLVGGAYFTALVNGNLTRPVLYKDKQYVRSYAMDPSNPYSSSQLSSYDYSSYFVRVRCCLCDVSSRD